ncbi:hypothetical protein [Mycolicibacterium llatzerense]|uniref:hypothetical protein n=1 Tax=Mycolicibacterium llatzerense TaxID=280871 RepID=UPI0013A6FFF3|nr:hypothetical protein [Mycolicibacterium llatzerense]
MSTYAVLLSSATEAVNGPELVCPERYHHAGDATSYGERMRREQGLEYEVMIRVGPIWRSVRGETAQEVIARRWHT